MRSLSRHIVTVMLSLAMMLAFMPAFAGNVAFADESEELTKAITALEEASPLSPVQWNADYTAKQDTNVIDMAQAIVDENSTGVEVTEVGTTTPAAAKAIAADGTITYPRSAATHRVVFYLETQSEEDFAEVDVSLPANVTTKSAYMQEFADSIEEDFLYRNSSADEVTSNLKIKTTTSFDCYMVDWEIPEGYLSKLGTEITVTRPSFETGDVSCTVKARVYWADEYGYAGMMGYVGDDPADINLEFPITIKAYSEEDKAAAEADLAAAWDQIGPIKNFFTGDETDLDGVDQDLQLPNAPRTPSGIKAEWRSSNPDVTEVKTLRAYPKRDEVGGEAKQTRLSLTLSKNGVTSTRSYPVTVLPLTQEELDAENAYLDAIANDISFDTIKKDNLNPEKVTGNFQHVYRGYYDAETGEITYKTSSTGNTGADIKWTYTSNVTSYGEVTRPTGTVDKEVTCKATIKSQIYERYKELVQERTVEFPIVVLAKETTVDLNEKPTVKGDTSIADFVEVGNGYTVSLDGIFEDLNGDSMTYKVSVDDGEFTAVEETSYTATWSEVGNHVLAFKANDGKEDSEDTYTVNLQVLNAEDADAAEELKNYKQEKINELKSYKDEADYRAPQKKELAAAISAGQDAINAAEDKAAVDDAVTAAKAELDKIKTNSQLTKEDLAKVIAEVEAFEEAMVTGDGEGEYPAEAKAVLKDAIKDAEDVYSDDTSDDLALLAATNDLKAALVKAMDSVNPTSVSINILGQDKENAFTKTLYPATVKSDAATNLGYEKPAEYKRKVVAIDGMVVLHQALYGEEFNNNPTDYLVMNKGGAITKIFGQSTTNLGYYVNYSYPTYPDDENLGSVAYDTVLEDGDMLNVWIYGTSKYRDKLLYFEENAYETEKPGEVAVKVYGKQAGKAGDSEEMPIEGGEVSVIDADGKEVASATADNEGIALIPGVPEGKYVITAKSIPYDEAVQDDHFVAPYATLSVGPMDEEVTVDIEAAVRNFEEADKFDIVPQDVKVSSHAAESYGDFGDYGSGNGDKVTVADLLYTLHKMRFGDDFTAETKDDYISMPGGWFKKSFGVETSSMAWYIDNYLTMRGSTYEATIESGDVFDMFMYLDDVTWSDVATCFDEQNVIVNAGEEFELNLMRVNWEETPSTLSPAGEGITAATMDKRGYLTEIKGGKADADGKVKILLENPGEYIVSATGRAAGQYGEGTIAAPHCKVTVVDSTQMAKEAAIEELRDLGEAARENVSNPYEADVAALKGIIDVQNAKDIDEVNAVVARVNGEMDSLLAKKAADDAEQAKKTADASKKAAEIAAKTPGKTAVDLAQKSADNAAIVVEEAEKAKAAADKAVDSAEKALEAAQTEKDKEKAQKMLDKATENAAKADAAKEAADKAKTAADAALKQAKKNAKPAAKVGTPTIRNTIANSGAKTKKVIYDKVSNATGYEIAYKARSSKTWATTKVKGNVSNGTIKKLSIKGLYDIKVRAKTAETSTHKATTGKYSNVVHRYFYTVQKIGVSSSSKGSFTIKWAKDPGATGYQVMYTTNKNGAGAAKNINTIGKNGTSFTKKGLAGGKTYYVQIRAIKKVGNDTYIGNISNPVPVKVK